MVICVHIYSTHVQVCREIETMQSGYKTAGISSALTSNSSATSSSKTHLSLSSTVSGCHLNAECAAIAQTTQLVDTPFFIAPNNPVFCSAIPSIVHLLTVEGRGGKEKEEK